MARWWAEFTVAQADELAYYRGAIERFGQPALDLACGTGRLLLPLQAEGLDVDGADVSSDMLAQAARLAEERGVKPALYAQAMHELDLPRRYRTIFICDSFGLGASTKPGSARPAPDLRPPRAGRGARVQSRPAVRR